MWFYDLLLPFLDPSMLAKYLENHDGDGAFLFYCFKHFAGATEEVIINADQQLTDNKYSYIITTTMLLQSPTPYISQPAHLENSQE